MLHVGGSSSGSYRTRSYFSLPREAVARLWAIWWVEETKTKSSVICTDPAAELMNEGEPNLITELNHRRLAGCRVELAHVGTKQQIISLKVKKF